MSERYTRRNLAFSLVELLIVVVILGILSALVFPRYTAISREARAKTAASNAHEVREMITVHINSGDYPLNAAGYPAQVYASWFRGNQVPDHPWRTQPFQINVVAAGSNTLYPAVKTFDLNDQAAPDSWYNSDNGRFIVLVPPQNTDQDTVDLFNMANATAVQNIGDTQ